MQKDSPIKLDIPSLDNLVKELHEAEKRDKTMANVIALIIHHRINTYDKHNFEFDYMKYALEVKEYIHA